MDDRILNLDEIIGETDVEEVVQSVLAEGDFEPTRAVESVLPYTKRVTYSDLIPAEYQNRLMALDWAMSNAYFELGDICQELIGSINRDRSKELGKVVSQTDIFEAVGVFTHRTARSIRYYWTTAAYFPKEIRVKYQVPFNVYAMARWMDNWELCLQIAESNPDWSCERVRKAYYEAIGQEPPVRQEKEPVPDSGAETEREEREESGDYKAVLLSRLEHSLDALRDVLDKIPLPTSVRVHLGEIILAIQDVGLEIRREV